MATKDFLTIFPQPCLDLPILCRCVQGRQAGTSSEAVAELHRPIPVELEVAVEVTASPDLLEGQGAGATGGPQKPQNHPKLPHDQLALGGVHCNLSDPCPMSLGQGSLSMMLVARLSCRH